MFDMKQCKPGDLLISCHGLILTYVGPNEHDVHSEYQYPHTVQYPNQIPYGPISFGTRTDDGHCFVKNRQPEDHDIVGFAPKGS
jgi:hypothetical protein